MKEAVGNVISKSKMFLMNVGPKLFRNNLQDVKFEHKKCVCDVFDKK